MTTRSFWRVVRNPYFYAITGAGILYMLLVVQQIGKIYGTETWPVTYKMVEILNGSFGLFLLVIIAFYAGELVWAERDVKMGQIADTMPVPNVTALTEHQADASSPKHIRAKGGAGLTEERLAAFIF